MSWLKRLLGLNPTREEFAAMMLDALAAEGLDGWERDDGQFALVSKERRSSFYLSNSYAEYLRAPRRVRPDLLKRIVALHRDTAPELKLDEVRWSLLPRVRERIYYEAVRLTALIHGTPASQLHRPLVDGMAVSLCVDFPDRILEVNADTARDWGMPLEELSALAVHNLRQRSKDTFEQVAPGVYASKWRDNHDASRILLTHEISHLRVKGLPVAIVPNRDNLLITGSDDIDGLRGVLAAAAKVLEEPRPMLGVPYLLEGERWSVFKPSADHPLVRDVERAWIDVHLMETGEQKALLDKLHERNGVDVHVATLSGIQAKSGEYLTYCVWVGGIEQMLPQSDTVVLMRSVDESVDPDPLMVPWDEVMKVAGTLLEPMPDAYPPRFRTRGFPSVEQVEALRPFARKA